MVVCAKTQTIEFDDYIGFKKGNATTDTLLYIGHQIANSISFRKHITFISLDFEKAYDKIGIHSIVDQLRSWKIGPNIIQYIIHFIFNRKIVVRIGKQHSNYFLLHKGIHQGSPLAIILFSIAYNILCTILPGGMECMQTR